MPALATDGRKIPILSHPLPQEILDPPFARIAPAKIAVGSAQKENVAIANHFGQKGSRGDHRILLVGFRKCSYFFSRKARSLAEDVQKLRQSPWPHRRI